MFKRRRNEITTKRLILRLPKVSDYVAWATLRRDGAKFLAKWEPIRGSEYPSRTAFRNRVYWANQAVKAGTGYPYLLMHKDGALLGAITLNNVQKGPAQTATVGYWIGPDYARQGYMLEALEAVVNYAFNVLDLSRIQAGCLPENAPSRALLEKSGFKYEGVAQSYLQIDGRWRDHVLYANLRNDRRGESDAV